MVHLFGGLVLQILAEVDVSEIWLHVLLGDLLDPVRNRS